MGEEQEERHQAAEARQDPEIHDSRGTFILLLFYLVVIVGLWGTVYFTLLERG